MMLTSPLLRTPKQNTVPFPCRLWFYYIQIQPRKKKRLPSQWYSGKLYLNTKYFNWPSNKELAPAFHRQIQCGSRKTCLGWAVAKERFSPSKGFWGKTIQYERRKRKRSVFHSEYTLSHSSIQKEYWNQIDGAALALENRTENNKWTFSVQNAKKDKIR